MYQWKMKVLVARLCRTLCNPMDCRPPGFSVHGILQERILEDSLLQGIFPTRGRPHLGLLHCRHIFTVWATREVKTNLCCQNYGYSLHGRRDKKWAKGFWGILEIFHFSFYFEIFHFLIQMLVAWVYSVVNKQWEGLEGSKCTQTTTQLHLSHTLTK